MRARQKYESCKKIESAGLNLFAERLFLYIMRILNAFYQYMTEFNGKEPMPVEVFKERKNVIIELSKKET